MVHKIVKINDQLEINIPLKTLISVGTVLLIAAWYVFTTQERITDIERQVKVVNEKFDNYTKQPSKDQGQIDLLHQSVDHLRKDVDDLMKK